MQASEERQFAAFRLAQFSGLHPAVAAAMPRPGVAAAQDQGWPASRDVAGVVLHFDVDSFYAQVEENRDPALRGKPIGVTQKFLVVTCNYEARREGVTKLMSISEAQRKCPALVLVSGEDLTPYREASKRILLVLQRYGTAERLGLDEVWVDVSEEVQRRIQQGRFEEVWSGHVHNGQVSLVQDSKHRPMDLRVQQAQQAQRGLLPVQPGASSGAQPLQGAGAGAGLAAEAAQPPAAGINGGGSSGVPEGWELVLMVGSQLAAEARRAVKVETGYRTSAGVACNKVLAKLVSGLHKPDDQTVLPPPEAAAFVAPLPLRALPGVGFKLDQELTALGVSTAGQLRSWAREDLAHRFGERVGTFLYWACRGQDASPVRERGPPKSVSVEDSFRSCASLAAARAVLGVLAPDLLARLGEELEGILGGGPKATPEPKQAAALVTSALALLKRHLAEPFDLTLLSIGATNFMGVAQAQAQGSGSMRSIAELLRGAGTGASSMNVAGVPASNAAGGESDEDYEGGVDIVVDPAAPAAAAAAAAAAQAAAESAWQRRDYGAAPAGAQLLSKRRERQMREGGAEVNSLAAFAAAAAPGAASPGVGPAEVPLGQQWALGGAVPSTHATVPGKQHAPCLQQTQQQSQQGRQGRGDGGEEGFWEGLGREGGNGGEEEEEEEEEGGQEEDLWADLGDIAMGACRRTAPARAAAAAAATGAGLHRPSSSSSSGHLPAAGSGPSRPGLAATSGSLGKGSAPPQREEGTPSLTQRRVIVHCDVDCFYCQVERLDEPSLRGVPLAVQQFNGGGFVAVSYEARAAGIRCGDGAGAGGRAHVPHLRAMAAMSLEECQRRCPGLQVRHMRTARYRQVAAQIQAVLRRFAPNGEVEKTSYDDFYVDVTAACLDPNASAVSVPPLPPPAAAAAAAVSTCSPLHDASLAAPPPGLKLVAGKAAVAETTAQRWSEVHPELRRGAWLAASLRSAVARELGGVTISCGVARCKLAARLAGPLCKPDGLTVLPDTAALDFVRSVPLRKIPSLRGKFGEEVERALGVAVVGDLVAWAPADLAARFGEQRGAFLASLPHLQDDAPVRERGAAKSLTCERSFPPTSDPAALRAICRELVRALLPRLLEDYTDTGRLPSRLGIAWRVGYTNPRSKSCAVLGSLLSWIRDACRGAAVAEGVVDMQQQVEGELAGARGVQQGSAPATPGCPPVALASQLADAYLAMLPAAAAMPGISRLSLGVTFSDTDAGRGTSAPAGQVPISGFLAPRAPAPSHTRAASAAPGDAAPPVQLLHVESEGMIEGMQPTPQQQQQHQGQGQQQHVVQRPSYRNPEALALLALAASGGIVKTGQGLAAMSPEERDSYEVALALQLKEAGAARALGGSQSRVPGLGRGHAGGLKRQGRAGGTIDAFLKRGKR